MDKIFKLLKQFEEKEGIRIAITIRTDFTGDISTIPYHLDKALIFEFDNKEELRRFLVDYNKNGCY